VEDRHAGNGPDSLRREGPPGLVDVQAQEVIEQVVLAGDRSEHRPDSPTRLVEGFRSGLGDIFGDDHANPLDYSSGRRPSPRGPGLFQSIVATAGLSTEGEARVIF